MFNIKEIFQASVCGFCENIYEYNSIDEEEFIEYLKIFLVDENPQSDLEYSTSGVLYDIENIENVCDSLYYLKNKYFKEDDVIKLCKRAYLQTLENDKTIKVEAFVDNLSKEFSKLKIR